MQEVQFPQLEQQFPQLSQTILNYVRTASEWELFHINPYELAKELNLNPDEVINWFLYAVYEGAFDLVWNSLCPLCGANEHQHGSLNQLETDFFCLPCNSALTGELDDKVEVAFLPRDNLRKLEIDPFEDMQSYYRYFFSNNYMRPKEMGEILTKARLGFMILQPGETQTFFKENLTEGQYRIISIDHHRQIFFEAKEGGAQSVNLEIGPEGLFGESIDIGIGKVNLTLTNHRESPMGLTLQRVVHEEIRVALTKERPSFKRFLSGKEVLNRQVFRELFSIQDLPADLNLRVGDVTLLFTDLKGSTALYEEAGDVDAFRLVKDHFIILTNVVKKHRGAVIKTIGDAVMAAFSTPLDGVQAALEMLQEVADYNQSSIRQVGLKVGLHKGPALAVNANQALDYFGRTVNIAARVQGQADAGEVWISEPIMHTQGITELLALQKYHTQPMPTHLRGIEQAMNLTKAIAGL